MYGSSYMFRNYIAILRECSQCLVRDAQLKSSRQNIVDGRVLSSDVATIVPHLVRNSHHFTEIETSLPHSKLPATCPYPEPARSSPYPHIDFLNIHLNIILPSTPESPENIIKYNGITVVYGVRR
jgi:hypothetical protein